MGGKDKTFFFSFYRPLTSLFFFHLLRRLHPVPLSGQRVLPCHSSDSSPSNSNGAEILFVIRYGNSAVISQMMPRQCRPNNWQRDRRKWIIRRWDNRFSCTLFCFVFLNSSLTLQHQNWAAQSTTFYSGSSKIQKPIVWHLWLGSRPPAPTRGWDATFWAEAGRMATGTWSAAWQRVERRGSGWDDEGASLSLPRVIQLISASPTLMLVCFCARPCPCACVSLRVSMLVWVRKRGPWPLRALCEETTAVHSQQLIGPYLAVPFIFIFYQLLSIICVLSWVWDLILFG